MTQAVGQRGSLPLYQRSQLNRCNTPSAMQAKTASGTASGGVKFGGGLSKWGLDAAVSTFEKITEVFLVGFLAQDGIAMWLPRVGASLKAGREEYEPQNDPNAKNLPFTQQIAKWAVGNFKGLNWENCAEGTKREFATGPGLLAVPAVAFLLNKYLGNSAKELSFNSLQEFGQGLSESLKGKSLPAKSAEGYAQFKTQVANYIEGMFQDPLLREKHGASLKKWSAQWAEAALGEPQAEKSMLDKGLELLHLKNTKKGASAAKGNAESALSELSEELLQKIRSFNRDTTERVLAYTKHPVIRDASPLHHADKTWVTYRPAKVAAEDLLNQAVKGDKATIAKAKKYVQQKTVGSLTEDLKRFGAYAKTVWADYAKQDGKKAVSEVAKDTMKSLAGGKFWLGIGTTVVALAYLTKLAFWAQSHDSYQETRMLKAKPSDAKSGAAAAHSASPALGQAPSSASKSALMSAGPFAMPSRMQPPGVPIGNPPLMAPPLGAHMRFQGNRPYFEAKPSYFSAQRSIQGGAQ